MPIRSKSKLLPAALLIAALLAFPAIAGATLAYVRNPLHPTIYVAADDGSSPLKLGPGSSPHLAPDGQSIAFCSQAGGRSPELKLEPVGGGGARTLMKNWREPFYLAWSPDSKMIAALRGPELGRRKLVVIDLASGVQHAIAQGFFSGFSFSPDGLQLVYSRAGSESYPPRSDVYRAEVPIPGATYVHAPRSVRITDDHRSEDPLWGPGNRVVFVKQLGGGKRRYGPKNELYLMSPDGGGVKRLTHTKVGPLLQGLYPTEWSADGSRLLAEFEGQDTSYAVTVDPRTGAQHPLGRGREAGFVGTALSADGTAVLGFTGGFDPAAKHNVATIPYAGGSPKVLAKNAYEADWSR